MSADVSLWRTKRSTVCIRIIKSSKKLQNPSTGVAPLMADMKNSQEVLFIPATSEIVYLSPLQKVRSRVLMLICRRERILGSSDNESPPAFVRTRTSGLLKHTSTLKIMWLLVIKRLEETTKRFYDAADCANRLAYMIHVMDLRF